MFDWFIKKKCKKLEYGKTVKDLKSRQSELLESVITLSYEVRGAIKSFNGNEVVNIGFETMSRFPFNKTQEINEKVKTTLTSITKRELIFISEIETGGSIQEHYHSDCLEIVTVNKGKMYDSVSGKTYKVGDTKKYEEDENHQIVALEELELEVTFVKTCPKSMNK